MRIEGTLQALDRRTKGDDLNKAFALSRSGRSRLYHVTPPCLPAQAIVASPLPSPPACVVVTSGISRNARKCPFQGQEGTPMIQPLAGINRPINGPFSLVSWRFWPIPALALRWQQPHQHSTQFTMSPLPVPPPAPLPPRKPIPESSWGYRLDTTASLEACQKRQEGRIQALFEDCQRRLRSFAVKGEETAMPPPSHLLRGVLYDLRCQMPDTELAPLFIVSAAVPVINQLVSAGAIVAAGKLLRELGSLPVGSHGEALESFPEARPLLDYYRQEFGLMDKEREHR